MILQIHAWENLKSFISKLNITIRYTIHGGDSVESVPEEVLISKKCLSPATWEIQLNNKDLKSAELYMNQLIEDLKREIEVNLSLDLNKVSIADYFKDIIITLDSVWDNLEYDSVSRTFKYSGICYHPDFTKYNLYNVFDSPECKFLPVLNNKLIELELFLRSINEYKKNKRMHEKSPTGNEKIEWKKQVNQLVGFYKNLIKDGFIETDTENLKVFLLNNFTWNGKPLSENTINTLFDPNKEYEKLPKEHKQINPSDFLEK